MKFLCSLQENRHNDQLHVCDNPSLVRRNQIADTNLTTLNRIAIWSTEHQILFIFFNETFGLRHMNLFTKVTMRKSILTSKIQVPNQVQQP